MKKHEMRFTSFIPGKLCFMLLTAFLFGGMNVSAQQATKQKPANEVVVKHQGSIGNKEYFSVKFPNVKGEKFSIRVKDGDGNVIFRNTFQEKNFDKSFQFDKLVDRSKLTFTIRTLKDNAEQVFVVNSKVFTVEQVEVTKAK